MIWESHGKNFLSLSINDVLFYFADKSTTEREMRKLKNALIKNNDSPGEMFEKMA